jgi:hypothetical protein
MNFGEKMPMPKQEVPVDDLHNPNMESIRVIDLTAEEYDTLANYDPEMKKTGGAEYKKFLDLAVSKGLKFGMGQGRVRINVGGKEIIMCTEENDFGTTVNPENLYQ